MTSGVNAPFIWGANGEQLTPEQIERRRKMADALIAKGTDFSPIQHPLQGVARVANALAGAIKNGQLDKAERENADFEQSVSERMLQAFGGGSENATTASTGETPAAPSFAGGGASRTMTMPPDPELAQAIHEHATKAGLDPLDVATAMSYETAGTFDPWKAGPTTQWGQHRGLIQWGEPQAKQYGVTADMPVRDQVAAAVKYLQDRGVKPGMGLMDIYSAINAGSVGRYNASDAANGGAPGTVADKVNNQMADHRKKAEALLSTLRAQQANPADIPAPGASPAALQGQGQGFPIPGQPAVAETEEDVQRLEQNMQPPQAANTGDVFSPVPMAQPQGFSATPREAIERAAQAAGLTEAANLPATAPLPPVRPGDVPAPDAQPAMGQMPTPQGGPSQEAITRALSDPNLSPSQVMALNGPNREATIAQILQSNPETAQAKPEDAKALVARALLGMPANDNQADLPTRNAQPASYQGTPKEGMSIATGGAFPQKALDDAAGGSSGVPRVAQAMVARGINPAIIEGMTNPRLSENTRRIATILFQQQMAAGKPELREVNGRLIEYRNGQVRDITPQGMQPGYRTLTNPAERAQFGIPENDNTPYQVGPDGKLYAPPRGMTVQNNLPAGEKEEDKERGKGLASRFNKMAEDGPQAMQDLAAAQRLDTLMRNVEPGTRTAALEAIRKVTGFDLDPNASNVQAASALIDYLVPRMRVAGSGASSDRDMQTFKNSLVSLMGTPEGNAIVMQTIGGMAQMRVQMARIAEDYQVGDIDAKTANQRIRDLGDPFAQFKQWQAAQDRAKGGKSDGNAAAAAPTGSPARPQTEADFNALPSGALYVDPDDGKTYRKP